MEDGDFIRLQAERAEFERAKERLTLKHRNTSQWARRALKRGVDMHDDGGLFCAFLDTMHSADITALFHAPPKQRLICSAEDGLKSCNHANAKLMATFHRCFVLETIHVCRHPCGSILLQQGETISVD